VVELTLNGKSIAQATPQPGTPFTLENGAVDPETDMSGILAIVGRNGVNDVVALGTAPQLEVLNAAARVRIFVQRPGSLVRAADLAESLPGQVFVTGRSVPAGGLSLPMNAPVFGTGQASAEGLSNELFVYNPITHQVQDIGTLNTARSGAASASAPDGRVFLFGGLAADETGAAVVSGQMDAFSLGRQNLSTFFVAAPSMRGGDAEAPRTDTVLVATQRPLFAVGGRDPAGQPLASVVSLDLDGSPANPIQTFLAPGATPRVGHTATLVDTEATWDHILIYGGAPAGQAVAEVLDPAARALVPLDVAATPGAGGPPAVPGADGHPGTGRRGHAALLLPTTPPAVLILGGLGDDGVVRADSILYDPALRRFRPGPFALTTPRANFVAFVQGKDVVVAGGVGPGGQPVGTVEIFDVDTGTRLSEQPAVARVGARATALPNLTVGILGGLEAGDVPSKAFELYLARQ